MEIIEKLNNSYSFNLNVDSLKFITEFTILWNLFELKYFKKNFKIIDLESKIKK